MIHVIAYDIANGRRLARVAKLCEDYGTRIERSVFEMELSSDIFNEFWRRMVDMIDEDVDSVVDYPVYSRAAISALGRADRPESGCLVF